MTQAGSPATQAADVRASWVPMLVIAMGQALISFNVAALPVSMGGIVESFNTPPTTVGTAFVTYSLAVSGFILLGARLDQRLGSRRMFRVTVLGFGAAMLVMALSTTATMMVATQGVVGLTCAALIPTLVVLIATHYQGRQQTQAVGWVGAAGASAAVLAFVIGGTVATFVTWRVTFGLLVVFAVATFLLSFRLKAAERRPDVSIDTVGVVLAGTAIVLITLGFNTLRTWGSLLARSTAPFDLLGVSPAPVLIVAGLVLGTAFFDWTHRRAAAGRTPLVALEVVDSPREWVAVIALFSIGAAEAAINFAVPLYIQIVQDRSSLETAMAMMPLMLSVVISAILVVRLYDRFSPRQLGRGAFLLVAVGTAWLAFVVRNDWSTVPVIAGLLTVGLGQGALMTLLLSLLVTAAPKELAGDVGSLRGVAQNLAAAVGTAAIGALLVGLLSTLILQNLVDNPVIPPEFKKAELQEQFDLDNINYIRNDQLKERLQETTATPEQVAEAVRINTESRLWALKIGFLVLSGMTVLTIIPCSWLPDYRPDEVSSDQEPSREE
jgi:MFS family permease